MSAPTSLYSDPVWRAVEQDRLAEWGQRMLLLPALVVCPQYGGGDGGDGGYGGGGFGGEGEALKRRRASIVSLVQEVWS